MNSAPTGGKLIKINLQHFESGAAQHRRYSRSGRSAHDSTAIERQHVATEPPRLLVAYREQLDVPPSDGLEKRVVEDIVQSLDRDSILRDAREEILRRLRAS